MDRTTKNPYSIQKRKLPLKQHKPNANTNASDNHHHNGNGPTVQKKPKTTQSKTTTATPPLSNPYQLKTNNDNNNNKTCSSSSLSILSDDNNDHHSVNTVYLVIHQSLPPACHMCFRDDTVYYSEPIQTINSIVVGVYASHAKAQQSAKRYFFGTLGHAMDTGESEEEGGYHFRSDNDGDSGTWEEEVYVQCETLQD